MTDERAPAADVAGDPTGSPPQLRRSALLRAAARAPDSYGLLLVLLLVDYVMLSVGWTGDVAVVVTTAFIAATSVLAFHTSRVGPGAMRAVGAAAAVAVVAAVALALSSATRGEGALYVALAFLILASPIAIVWRIVRHARVTAETLLGAICVYILIGLVFSYLDLGYQLASGSSFFAQSGEHGPAAFVYFSFITMTTVGYGDLSPATGLPRTLAVLDALTGQIFLVVLVSRLVAMLTPGRRTLRARLQDEAGGSGGGEDGETTDAGPSTQAAPGDFTP